MMARSDHRMISTPHRVLFAGFESTTTVLQRAGWSLTAEEDYAMSTCRLLMRFEPADLYMMADQISFDYFKREVPESLTFVVRRCSSRMTIQLMERQFNFKPIDAETAYIENPKDIKDMMIFGTPLVRTEEILIEPSTVEECLDLIKRIQSPRLAEIRKGQMRDGALPQQKFHAQIMSLAA